MLSPLSLKVLRFCCFQLSTFGEIKAHSLRTTPFQKKKKNWYGSFRYVSILRKKVFSGARVQCFSHCGSNNSDSAVFGNADFGEIKYHSLRTTSFQKKLSMEVFGLCLTYVERYFQEDQWIVFLFMAQVTQILLFLGMLLLERSKITDF